MNMSDTPEIPANVMSRMVGDEIVILDVTSGLYFGLDAVGARVWSLLLEGKNLREICDSMIAEYAVEPERLTADVQQLMADLVTHKLVKMGPDAQSSEPHA